MVSRLESSLRQESLEDGREQAQIVVVLLALVFRLGGKHVVGQHGDGVHHAAPTLGEGLAGQEHAAHVGVHDDGISSLTGQ